ncbi:MAG: TMEM175 family protein [Pyrinomonadaceae bacterium]|nr:TMEM175 family protein [Pyrinomonadaceae bacterium]
MFREQMIKTSLGKATDFRWRGHEISRIEGLSDAVFGFAVTLLVVSLEVPKTFNELAEIMRGFGAFAISFALLFGVWFNHYKFFRRYGLQDTTTVVLSGVLLFVVLFYVYPLKFLFSTLVDRLMGGHGEVRLPNGNVEAAIEPGQMASVMIIFDIGYLAVFAVFFLLFWHAFRKREELELNALEVFDTRISLQEMALNCGIALLSLAIVLLGGPSYAGVAGLAYMLTGVVLGTNGMIMGRRRRRMARQFASASE